MSVRIVFMGTPEFAVPSLRRLAESGYAPIAVATSPDRRQGRGRKTTPSAVKTAALELGITTILQPESVKEPSFADEIGALAPDIIVVVAFRILPPAVYEKARLGAFNLHGSLLPRYRGAAPIHHAVLAGEPRTGVTTFFLKQKVDTGDMILQREMEVGPNETTGDVHDRMMYVGAEAVLETVRLIESGSVPTARQDDALATPAPKVFREDAEILWDRSAVEVHNRIRGMSPTPGAFTTSRGKLLKLLRSTVADDSGRPGEILEAASRLVIACGIGAVEIVELQLEGRPRMSAGDFLRGHALHVGDVLPS